MKEIWKDVAGYEKTLIVSNYGNIFNKIKKCYMKQFLSGKGYKTIYLWFPKTKKKKSLLVHRLVAKAFIPNINNLQQINHIDGNKENNFVGNLEWCSPKDNNIHAIKNGLRTYTKIMKPILKIKNGIVLDEYCSLIEASRKNNIDAKSLWCVVNNKPYHKTAGGYEWRYK